MNLSLENVVAYPIPDTTPNSIWGCLLLVNLENHTIDIRLNTYVQAVNPFVYIPEKTILYPILSKNDIDKLFLQKLVILHPHFGLVELSESINWLDMILVSPQTKTNIRRPDDSVFIPKKVKSFQVVSVSVEDTLEKLEETIFPKQQTFDDKPLNSFEKAKLFVYDKLFTKNPNVDDTIGDKYLEKPLFTRFKWLTSLFSKKQDAIAEEMKLDLEDLEKRNEEYLDKLLEMLKNNPEEALKYAIPLDDGTSRGDDAISAANFSKQWSSLLLNGNQESNIKGGGVLFNNDHYEKLQREYFETAQRLIAKKEYHKAAFIFIKLLKNNYQAAKTLEDGGLYQEAAAIYLKYVKNKNQAAICYEKGNMIHEAIALYKELNLNEKAGDLYISINRQKEAFMLYQKVVDEYSNNYQYIKASLIYKNKMFDVESSQALLFRGWINNRDAFNCLNNYLNNLENDTKRWQALVKVYKETVSTHNEESFLNILKYEFERENEFNESIRDIAYEVITNRLQTDPSIVSELKTFNQQDKQLVKDTIRYKLNVSKKY
ncbi:hypothetical protein J2Y60_000854 [Arcicella sp. BE140]|nr:hypothetical protein [Arcicella sp. BE51]MDR6810669.1 hypothetical protein [Arcicella sp. BE140]MDR6822019.1 hypothetical protein [Arcicella sp. BE139]